MKRDSDPGTSDAKLRDILSRTTAAAHAVSSARPGHVHADLALALARILGTDAALIAEFIDDRRRRMRTLALVFEGRLLRPIQYDVEQTPCRHIVGRESRIVSSGVNAEFAPGTLFAAQGFDAYAGYSIPDSAGAQAGIIVALDRKPIPDRELTEALLKIFATRAGAEIDRARAESALRASETSYRAIFDAAEDAIFVHDWDTGRIVDANPKACSAYGWSREEMLQRSLEDFSSNVPPYTLADAIGHIDTAKRGLPVRFEWHRRSKDGSLHWDEVVLQPATIGGVPRILAFTREVTERKAALETLREREEQYRDIFNASADALVLWNKDLKIVDVNPAFERIYRYSRGQAIGNVYPEHFPRDYVEQRLQLVRRALAGEACELLTHAFRPSGERFEVELRMVPIHHRGEPHVLSVARDITERRHAEELLRASEVQYRSIFNASADAMVLRDADLKLVDANAAFLARHGVRREEVLGCVDVSMITPASAPAVKALMREALAGRSGAVEAQTVARDGAVLDIEVRALPMQYGGRPHVLSIARDITARKRAEAQRGALEAQLRQAQKMEAIGQLTGGIAHDFNNILASVMGYVELAEDRAAAAADSRALHYLGEAQASCRRARDLIQQMLLFSRGSRGEASAVSLTGLVREALPMLRSVLPTTLAIEVDCDEGVPAVWIDELQAHQVLLNLAINARDAMKSAGHLRIRVTGHAATDVTCTSCRHTLSGPQVELAVTDTGSGIAPDLLERIFDPFFTTKEPGKGTGMGLSMVHGIVHEHGGHIVVDTAPGAGSTFRVLWPVERRAAQPRLPAAPERRRPAALTGRVLLVDDEPAVLEPMRELLESWGLDVAAACTPGEAQAAYERDPHAFDLLVTDHAMPLASGLELATRLRALRPDLRWLLYTGFADEATVERAKAQGAAAVLGKPVESAELRAAVEACLRLGAARP